MAKGYGFEVSDWILAGAVIGAFYLLYKTSKSITELPGDIATNTKETIINTSEKFKETVQGVGKNIFLNDGLPSGYVAGLPLPNYQKEMKSGKLPSGNATKRVGTVNAAIYSGGYYSSSALNQKVQPISQTPAGNITKHATAYASAVSSGNYYVGSNLLKKQPELQRNTAKTSIVTTTKDKVSTLASRAVGTFNKIVVGLKSNKSKR